MIKSRIAFALVCALCFIRISVRPAHAGPGLLTTSSWQAILGSGTLPGTLPFLGTDSSGNAYTAYLVGNAVRLRCTSPAENTIFDISVDTFASTPDEVGVFVSQSPTNRFVDVLMNVPESSSNESAVITRFDRTGNPLWGGNNVVFNNITGGDWLIHYQADAAGNGFVMMRDIVGSQQQLMLASIAPNGTVNASKPVLSDFSVFGTTAVLLQTQQSEAWVVAGFDKTTSQARVGEYDVVNGQAIYAHTIPPPAGFHVTDNVSPAPNDRVYLAVNYFDNTSTATRFQVSQLDASGNSAWTYPAGGSEIGLIRDVHAGFGGTTYLVGRANGGSSNTRAILEKLDAGQGFAWRLSLDDVENFVPGSTQDDFWYLDHPIGSSNRFLEHGDGSGTIVFGRSYPGLGGPVGLADFRNALYFLTQTSGPAMELDRFKAGTAVASVSLPPTMFTNGTAMMTITLNESAPQGGYAVSISSYSNLISFNGVGQSTVLTIPAGQISGSVIIVSGNSSGAVDGIVIDEGDRNNWHIQVQAP